MCTHAMALSSCCCCGVLQVQDLLLGIMCSSSVIILLLGVMTRFVMEAQQARLMWCVLNSLLDSSVFHKHSKACSSMRRAAQQLPFAC
jgi:hypothetical protein